MLDIKPFFNIDFKGEIAILTIAGLWDKSMILDYQQTVDQILATTPLKRVFPITNLQHWSLPDLEILTMVNGINKKVQRILDYKYNALITPQKHKQLFLEVVQQFNHEDTNIEAQAFDSFQDAVNWGKSLGYNFDEVPADYDLKLFDYYQK